MAEMGYGYGSECHLLRWMGRHRTAFDEAIRSELRLGDASAVEWLDQPFDDARTWPDGEWRGIEFLRTHREWANLSREWRDVLPYRDKYPSWDAVGRVNPGGPIILLEAKAHLGELETTCTAGEKSWKRISDYLASMSVTRGLDRSIIEQAWMRHNYQWANRLIVQDFLVKRGIQCHLAFVYFLGESHETWKCASTVEEWQKELSARKKDMGSSRELERWSDIFLPVVDEDVEPRWN
jgi:hypothetical protein